MYINHVNHVNICWGLEKCVGVKETEKWGLEKSGGYRKFGLGINSAIRSKSSNQQNKIRLQHVVLKKSENGFQKSIPPNVCFFDKHIISIACCQV